MPSSDHLPEIFSAISELQKFGILTDNATQKCPIYHGYLGTHTNATIGLLASCANILGADIKCNEMTEGQWTALAQSVHRVFYTSLASVAEGLCYGILYPDPDYENGHSYADPMPFMSCIGLTLKKSSLSETRKIYWRRFFDALRILRNKSAHFHPKLSSDEIEVITLANLQNHIAPNHTIHTNWKNYGPLAQAVYDFIIELEASKNNS